VELKPARSYPQVNAFLNKDQQESLARVWQKSAMVGCIELKLAVIQSQ